jgi:large subunit ribosomal protein L24
MALGIKKEDTVLVITGKEAGKRGRVLSVNTTKGRVVVERVNMVKKHMKPNRQYQQGGIIEREAAIHGSNLMLVCPKCDVPTRIGALLLDDGRKVRQCKKCKEVIDR